MSRKLKEKADRLLSLEKGTVFKDPGGRVNVCLVYPNTYHVGMSNLGFQGVYTLLNDRADSVCERAFLPDPEDLEEYERTGTELFSLESKRPLRRFDIVAFSLSFENDYPNVLRILDLAHIPPESSHRGAAHPLLIAGGVCAFSNPEPLAPFFDICFVGEAEEMLHEFIDVFAKAATKEAVFRDSLGIEGIYIPRFYEVSYGRDGLISGRAAAAGAPERVRRRYVKELSAHAFRPSITTPATEFSGMALVEAARGCPWNCSFCLAGHIYGPPRRKPREAVRAEILEARGRTRRVGLIAPSLSDYPRIEEVLEMEGVDFSITSLRASPRSADLVALMEGHKSVSIAPEAGSARLRKVINKNITGQDILETAGLIFSHGIERLRLYFMVGLPTETEEDIEGMVRLVKEIRGLSEKGFLIITLSTFVPKPFTPFQWHPMAPLGTVKSRMKTVKKALGRTKGVKIFHDVPKYAYMQGMFSMGDRRVAGGLVQMKKEADWRRAAAAAGIDPDFFVMRKKDFTEAMPWDFIDTGTAKESLWQRYLEAMQSGPSP
jgi:radical SAM superfamily enzyme YgiQ (UPF0313 family)